MRSKLEFDLFAEKLTPDKSRVSPGRSRAATAEPRVATSTPKAVAAKPILKRKLLQSEELPLGSNALYNAARKKQQQVERQKMRREEIILSLKANSG
ncbi:hypothetical protein LTR84_007886 [Exophiala bonariae]|uniref:Uncharacterized protein n=1 Tax=Exophiala bonariae TaxID=1690606 RepID=A0AAV9NLG1_9EURO|nr:hypothetical protein LTR84_007886 [Exophiala bonariae]